MHDAALLLWGGVVGAWIACAVVALILSRRHGFTRLLDSIIAVFGAPGAAAALLRLPNFRPVLNVEEIATVIAAVEAMPGPHVSIEDHIESLLIAESLFLYKTRSSDLIPFDELLLVRKVATSVYLYDIIAAYPDAKAYALSKGVKIDD